MFEPLPLTAVEAYFKWEQQILLTTLQQECQLSNSSAKSRTQQVPTRLHSLTHSTLTTPPPPPPPETQLTDTLSTPSAVSYKPWSSILNYTMTDIADDYPVLQLDETIDVVLCLATVRLYMSIQALTQASPRSHSRQPQRTPHRVVTFRQLLEHVQGALCVRPQRMIDLEGLPLCAAPRLQFGREWFGELGQRLPNFVSRWQNCRYLIEISGVRRLLSFEDGTNDSTRNDRFHTSDTVQCFVDEEKRAWTCACAVWNEQLRLLQQHPSYHTRATHTQLLQLFTERSAMFRYGPFHRKYLSKLFVEIRGGRRGKCASGAPRADGFCNIPIIDYTAPDKQQVFRILRATQFFDRRASGKVFVHCAGGWGRTGMALLLLTMALLPNDYRNSRRATTTRNTRKPKASSANKASTWEDAMQLMLRRYKRQSIEEVWHLFHLSHENTGHWKRMEQLTQRVPTATNAQSLWKAWSGIVSPDAVVPYQKRIDNGESLVRVLGEAWRASRIKFDVVREGSAQQNVTVTYHARNIPLFQSWVNAYFSTVANRCGHEEVRQRRRHALALGRPVYASVTDKEYRQRMDEENKVREYVGMQEKIHQLYDFLEHQHK